MASYRITGETGKQVRFEAASERDAAAAASERAYDWDEGVALERDGQVVAEYDADGKLLDGYVFPAASIAIGEAR